MGQGDLILFNWST